MQQLKVGSSLQGGKYKIEKVLGQGGFGITYLATQELLDRKVCIKEFFFKEYCERDEATNHVSLGTQSNHELVERFMTKFLKEARTISQLEHPHIIRIHDIFKENNTAYYVMEYIEGESLADRVNHYGCLPESEAVKYIKQVASALDFIHQQSINHLDVKPANIMIRKSDNKAVLIDFGLSKQYDAQGGQTSTTPVGISHGYAPMEQYNVGGVSTFSPQTDIYSLGATLYKLVTGNTPPQASDVLNDGLPELPSSLSSKVKNAIIQAMQVRKKDRPEDVKAFLELLDASTSTISNEETKIVQSQTKQVEDEVTMIMDKPEVKEKVYSSRSVDDSPKPTISFEPEEKRKKKKNNIPILIGVVVILVGIITFAISGLDKGEPVMTKNADVIAKELEEKRINDSIANVRREEAEKRRNDSINAINEQARLAALRKKEEVKKEQTRLEEKRNMEFKAECDYELATDYYFGRNGKIKDYSEAVKWFRSAAEKGHVLSQNFMGVCYADGKGVKQDYVEAVKWYRKTAEQGDAVGLFSLGYCYANGHGVAQSYSEAAKWFRKSAEQGYEGAMSYLGEYYSKGKGVEKDDIEAFKWLSKAADKGEVFSQRSVGFCYEHGLGVGQNLVEAVKWYRIAADNGDDYAKEALKRLE